jgi:hypothetical protein
MLVASSEKLLSILDSGSSYPFELYISGEEKVLKYVGRTDVWNKHSGILLLPDLKLFFKANPEYLEGFKKSDEITLVLRDNNGRDDILRYTVLTKGSNIVI